MKNLRFIAQHENGVAVKWYRLGVELLEDNGTAELDKIRSCIWSRRNIDRCNEMFTVWLKKDPKPSWSKVITALNNVQLNAAAANVQRRYATEEGYYITIEICAKFLLRVML